MWCLRVCLGNEAGFKCRLGLMDMEWQLGHLQCCMCGVHVCVYVYVEMGGGVFSLCNLYRHGIAVISVWF